MTEGRFVINASPLIFLTKIGQIDLLRGLASAVVVPSSVLREVLSGGNVHPDLHQISEHEWIRIERDLQIPEEIAGWDLGAGESQVLAFAAAQPNLEAILDDLQARRCARSLGIVTTGTVGVILRAKRRGLVPKARPLLEELVQKQMYLSRDLLERALAEVGE